MMSETRRTNRGPQAAASNRRALVSAARRVFSVGGLSAPLSSVAREAGVGQGSLYRHFPDRIDLALAVFERNVTEMETLAADPITTLDTLLEFLTERSIDSVAFVEMISSTTDDRRLVEVVERVTAALAEKLGPARDEGLVRPDLEAEDLFLALGMVSNLLAKTPAADRRTVADAAWALLRRGLEEPKQKQGMSGDPATARVNGERT